MADEIQPKTGLSISTLVILIVAIAIVFGGGGYLYGKSSAIKEPEASVTPVVSTTTTTTPSKTASQTAQNVQFESYELGIPVRIQEKNYKILSSQREFAEFLSKNSLPERSGRASMGVPGKVDFDKESIIVVSPGWKGSTGYEIEVSKITSTSNTLNIYVTNTSPGKGCVNATMVTNPYAAYEMPKTDKKVEFIEENVVRDCT